MKNGKYNFLNNTLIALYTLSLLCFCAIIFEIVDNYSYSKNGIETQGKVIGFISKKGNFNKTHISGANYPIIKYQTVDNDSASFTSSYSYNVDINEAIAIRYIPYKVDKVHINTFSINWFFSIFAAIIMLVCSVFIVVIRYVLKYFKEKDEYINSLTCKTKATVVKVEKVENGWGLSLIGNIPEQNNRSYTFFHFTPFDSEYLLGQSFEVRYNSSDIEQSYILDIEHSR